jgi:hypothetical protein
MEPCDKPAQPGDTGEFLERVGTKAPQPTSAAQVRSIVDKIKGRVRQPTEKAKPEWFEQREGK